MQLRLSNPIDLGTFVLLVACGLSIMGCPQKLKGERMITEEQAIELAKEEFNKHGRSSADYDISIEIYYVDQQQWIIWFDKKGPYPIPGGKHAVLVHKITGQSIFMPGQ
ncbi:MAG: hypothetical protein RKR03_10800 [Candidatus Competibacter sp.]|nr:hypothetical protein [Candidatus Competibacter sp.]MDS4069127.1 hypothetical protein [Candidatus Competibacter sp.]